MGILRGVAELEAVDHRGDTSSGFTNAHLWPSASLLAVMSLPKGWIEDGPNPLKP